MEFTACPPRTLREAMGIFVGSVVLKVSDYTTQREFGARPSDTFRGLLIRISSSRMSGARPPIPGLTMVLSISTWMVATERIWTYGWMVGLTSTQRLSDSSRLAPSVRRTGLTDQMPTTSSSQPPKGTSFA